MTDLLPILLAVLILLVNALYSAKWGFLYPMAGATAAVISIAAFLGVFHYLPVLADTFLDLPLGWRFPTIAGLVFALIVFVLARFPAVWGLKRLIGSDSWLHSLADGFPGALLSLIPSGIAVLFLFSCFRIAGTSQELRFVAALSREGIENMGEEIPPYPQAERWRAKIEALPGVTGLLDRVDPFSPALYRNTAAVIMLDQSSAVRSFLRQQDETSSIFSKRLLDLNEFPGVQKAIGEQDGAAIVLDSNLREKTLDSELSPALKALQLRPVLERFVDSLVPPDEPGTNPLSN